jgi:hypothetical protein
MLHSSMTYAPVRFGSDSTHLTVTPLEPTEYGTRAEVSFRVRTFSGTFEAIVFFRGLLEKVESLHRSLRGSVDLGALDDEFRIDLAATSLGHITASVELYFEGSPEVRLKYEFEIDQTYLPPVIRALQQNAPLLEAQKG